MIIPPKDYGSIIRKAMYEKWQRIWDGTDPNNKLKEIKSKVHEWSSSISDNRRTEVTMTRLRIGHTHLTHSFLMTMPHDPIPMCDGCGAQQSVKHFIKQCPALARARDRYFRNKTLKEILGEGPDSSVTNVIAYLREVELLDKI